jgi:hypothetical protein
MKAMKLVCPIVIAAIVLNGLMGLPANAVSTPSPWEQPAAKLTEEIAEIMGPGQARLIIRNVSSISTDEIPAIRRLLEQDLKAHGVLASGTESANTIRVTLSENLRERLWVAEVIEGTEIRVAMVHVEPGAPQKTQSGNGIMLRKQSVVNTREEVLAALEISNGLVVVEPEEIVIYEHTADGMQEKKRIGIGQKKPLARDPRGMIFPAADGGGFEAFVAGMACSGSIAPTPSAEWAVHCRESDEPWLILQGPIFAGQSDSGIVSIKAFYNTARDYFTGVVTPSVDVELSPFYSAALLPRSDGAGLLINGIDGKVQLVESGKAKPIAGARDWGSDFAALQTGCGAGMHGTGTQIVASGSGEAIADSLRAYELPAQEAIPASAPLATDGTVTALWTAPNGKSIFAVVRHGADEYEVDRVTASCN